MAKEPKRPSVSSQLDITERRLALEDALMKAESDPLSLIALNPAGQLIQEGEASDMRQALSHAEVRRVFYRTFKLGGLMDADSDPNPTIMAHHAGRRSLALDLYNAIKKVDPNAYYQMEREHDSNLKSREKLNAE